MNTRIRKKVALIRQSDANPEDNLAELDLRIHKMSPTVVDFDDPNFTTLNEDLRRSSVEMNYEFARYDDFENDNQNHMEIANSTTVKNKDLRPSTVEINCDFVDYEELQNDNENHMEIANSNVESTRSLVIQNEEELETYMNYMNEPIIIEEDSPDESIDLDANINNVSADIIKQTITSPPTLSKKLVQPSQKIIKSVEAAKVKTDDY